MSEELSNRMIEEATRPLRDKISELEFRNSETVVQLRESFSREFEEMKRRMAQNTTIKDELMEEESIKAKTTIQQLTTELTENKEMRRNLENRLKQTEDTLKDYEGRIQSHELELGRYAQQVSTLNGRVNEIQNSAYFQSPENTISLSFSKSQ
jgi:chromosome segregation ATPase